MLPLDWAPDWQTCCVCLPAPALGPLQEIAALTVQQEQLARRAEATQQRRDAMLAQVASLKEAAAGAEGQLAGLQEGVDKVAAEVGGWLCSAFGH
jgi:hypothetical protein